MGTGLWGGHKGVRSTALSPTLCPQGWPRALEGSAEPQPGAGAPGSHPGAAGTRIQRRGHRRHLWGLHLPAEPFRWVGVRGVLGGGVMGSLRGAKVWYCRERSHHISSPRGAPGAPGPTCAACVEPRPRAPGDQDAVQQCPAWAGAGGDWGWGGGDGVVGTAGCKGVSWGDGEQGVMGIRAPGEMLGAVGWWGPRARSGVTGRDAGLGAVGILG